MEPNKSELWNRFNMDNKLTEKSKKKPTRGRANKDTKFKPGNQFWKARSSHGRKPKFSDPDVLWQACIEYFQWVEDNPLREEKVFCYQGNVTRVDVAHIRAMTIGGLCLFLNIAKKTWFEYAKKSDFSNVTTRAEETIRAQKFEGAAADMLNPNIIARDLGLRDHKNVNVSGDGLKPTRTPEEIEMMKEIGKAFAEKLK